MQKYPANNACFRENHGDKDLPRRPPSAAEGQLFESHDVGGDYALYMIAVTG
jgi:hypothetical protein